MVQGFGDNMWGMWFMVQAGFRGYLIFGDRGLWSRVQGKRFKDCGLWILGFRLEVVGRHRG